MTNQTKEFIRAFTHFEDSTGNRQEIICPAYVDDRKIKLTENALKVLVKRYIRNDEHGKELETIAGMFYRVAHNVSINGNEEKFDDNETTKKFYHLLSELRFLPNSPTFTGSHTPLGQLAACFVLPISDDMGKSKDGIFSTLRVAALIQQTGGGNGFDFSKIRPRNDVVHASSGISTGPVGFLKVYDAAFGEIAQGGTRRGANMAVLRVDHPDIEEFISCKSNENEITNFNISVALTDEFMLAVENDNDFNLINPRTKEVVRTVRATSLFDKIIEQAHSNGEPGALFIDTAERDNPVPNLYKLEATNPCGEQWLGPYENCCLGSINLAVHTKVKNGERLVDWDKLKVTIEESTHFLDNVITANKYVPSIPEIQNAAFMSRRIGLGIMGLADMMYMMGIRYGSEESYEFSAQIMEFVRFYCMNTSVTLSIKHGSFDSYYQSVYNNYENEEKMSWIIPSPLDEYKRNYFRGFLDWTTLKKNISNNRIRNAAQCTIAPTGTLSTVAGLEGYGCEPVFALGYIRHFKDGDEDVELVYTSPLFDNELNKLDISEEQKESIRRRVAETGSCQDIEELPDYIKEVFVVSSDITAEEHVGIQSALQSFVDNSISKTCNFPENATVDDVKNAYMNAWDSGCKGLTVYVTGSRDKVVLETQNEKSKKEQVKFINWKSAKRQRPEVVSGTTYKKNTPLGIAYITVNEDDSGDPFEVFVNIGKAGSNTSAVSEAIGRLLSLVLRIESSVSPYERTEWIIDELKGIGSGKSIGFGTNKVGSLPDGIAQVLSDYIKLENNKSEYEVGDICPDCGSNTLLETEGCRKCVECGYSEC